MPATLPGADGGRTAGAGAGAGAGAAVGEGEAGGLRRA